MKNIEEANRIIENVIEKFEIPVNFEARRAVLDETKLKEREVLVLGPTEIQEKIKEFLIASKKIAQEKRSARITREIIEQAMKVSCPHPWC